MAQILLKVALNAIKPNQTININEYAQLWIYWYWFTVCENLTLLHEKEIHKDRCTEIDMYKISLWKDILKSYGHQSANINKTNNQQSKTQEKWRWKSRFKERHEICGEVKPINWVTSLQLYGDNQTRLNFHLLHHPY